MKTKLFSRRNFLRMAVVAGASTLPLTQKVLGNVLSSGVETVKAAPAAPAAPAATPILAMHFSNELTDGYVSQFNIDFPSIILARIDVNMDQYYSLFAAGNPPDLLRVQAPVIPNFLTKQISLNLQPYFDVSPVLDPADLDKVNDYYKAKGPFHIGEGDLYGMAADWSPDSSLWVNETVFETAGVTPPNPADMPLDKDKLIALCTAVTDKSAGRIGYAVEMSWIDRLWMVLARDAGGSLYANDFSRINIVGNSAVEEAIKFYYDLAAGGLIPSPNNPVPDGWSGNAFVAGHLAMLAYGYWFAGFSAGRTDANFQQAVADGKIKMYPNITWHGVRDNPSITATGAIISSPTQFPNAAWRVFEWYMGGQPAHDRVSSGRGLPALKSMNDLVPKTGALFAQVWGTVVDEQPYTTVPLHFNPFLKGSETLIPAQVFKDHWGSALNGDITFSELLALIEAETNAEIKEMMPKVYLPLVSRS